MGKRLTVYDFTNDPDPEKYCSCVNELLLLLRQSDINTNSIEVKNGNKSFPDNKIFIERVMDYFSKKSSNLFTYSVYYSFCFIKDQLDNLTKNMSYFTREDELKILEMTEGLDIADGFWDAIIVIGEKYELKNPFGDAYERICINRKTHKHSIWHETAHLLGAQDHYDEKSQMPIDGCKDKQNCFMQWNSLNGSRFCEKSLEEIQKEILKL